MYVIGSQPAGAGGRGATSCAPTTAPESVTAAPASTPSATAFGVARRASADTGMGANKMSEVARSRRTSCERCDLMNVMCRVIPRFITPAVDLARGDETTPIACEANGPIVVLVAYGHVKAGGRRARGASATCRHPEFWTAFWQNSRQKRRPGAALTNSAGILSGAHRRRLEH